MTKEFLWFVLHLSALYFSVKMWTPWLAGRVHDWILPLLRESYESRFQFLFSHLFAFSFVPAFALGLVNYKYRHTGALFVWIVPTLILAYQFVSYPTTIFESRITAAYHHFFAGNFIVPEYRDYREMFAIAAKNSDMLRGIDQLRFTAPFYTGIAYSVSSLFSMRAASFTFKKSRHD